jgi:hypothetical protein
MSDADHQLPDISVLWDLKYEPAYCPKCEVAHLVPNEIMNPLCPACHSAQLEPQPSITRPEPPELILDYKITNPQLRQNLNEWLNGVWLRPKELNEKNLIHQLTKTFIPIWLIDGKVTGTWQTRMGFDYQVASSQEIFLNGSWTTRKKTETRIRWEPRAGAIDRYYKNLKVPALEEHSQLTQGLGRFRLATVTNYSSERINMAFIRVPNLLPDEAWPTAKSSFDRLAASDCQVASNAQHFEDFQIHAEYQDQNWTQLLLPVFTTAYRDEDGKTYPILINGQNGKIFGVKRASPLRARNWGIGLLVVALACFIMGIVFAAGTIIFPLLAALSFVFFASTLIFVIAAPIPAVWVWNFNKSQDQK